MDCEHEIHKHLRTLEVSGERSQGVGWTRGRRGRKGIPQLVDASIVSCQTPAADRLFASTLDLAAAAGLAGECALLGRPGGARGCGRGGGVLVAGGAVAVAVGAVFGGARGRSGC